MTYEESITALELCGDENNCTKCPCRDKRFEPDTSCAEEMMRSAAEQMKRLKAENKDLKYSLGCSKASREWLKSCIETLKQKAVNEIVTMLREKSKTLCVDDGWLVHKNDIADIVDELTPRKETTVSMIDGHIEE